MSEDWNEFSLHKKIQEYLLCENFTSPTPIQKRVLLKVLKQPHGASRDVIGEAPTGSGKTLAFGIPIVNALLEMNNDQASCLPNDVSSISKLTASNDGISALILVPTRELGLQVHEHLYKIVENTSVRLVALIGGISVAKQKRLLSKRVDILVATPGRLWSFLQQKKDAEKGENMPEFPVEEMADEMSEAEDLGSVLLSTAKDPVEASRQVLLCDRLKSLKWLVIDEVDRMVETGHFKDLFEIFKFVRQVDVKNSNKQRRTFIFSATMSVNPGKGVADEEASGKMESLGSIMKKIPFQDVKPLYIHVKDVVDSSSLSPNMTQVVSKVKEYKLCVKDAEKDLAIYRFLLANPGGKKLMFVNSIDNIRRLVPLFKNLGIVVFPLHSQMEQRQRLKNLDRFKTAPTSSPEGNDALLICTDVVGRGIDIPAVDVVLHYSCPRSQEIYVHRSGRTGRGLSSKDGMSILFLSSQDLPCFNKLSSNKLTDFVLPPVDRQHLGLLQQRLAMAKDLDLYEYELRKLRTNASLSSKISEAFELDDDELLLSKKRRKRQRDGDDDDEGDDSSQSRAFKLSKQIKELQRKLKSSTNMLSSA